MKCPECNTEVDESEQYCPNCGTPLRPDSNDDEPTLGRGLVIFIIIGTIFLVAFGFLYYSNHKNDPEYTQTAIEPDSNLAENYKAKFDTIVKDTTAKDSIDIQEEEQAEKVFNSIRRHHRVRHKSNEGEVSSAPSDEQERSEETSTSSSSSDPTSSQLAPVAPKPHTEPIETE
ncbi:MAG: zinc ribbon domain-containing protein [Prevotella sp.]|nr:zinc ribbon domain-containing protein [Prevotella sp.]